MVKFRFFHSMSFCSRTANYLYTFSKISGREVLLFLKVDISLSKPFKIDEIF